MWILRRMGRVQWPEHRTNEEALSMMQEEGILIKEY
jgi:hypothetical protein